MPENPTRGEVIATLASQIEGIPVAMLTTTGMGRLRSRPMVMQKTPFDGVFWFVTERGAGKTGAIRDRRAVHLTWVSVAENRYVWASGTATLVDDPARLKALWHAGYQRWIPGGPDDPGTALIGVRVEEAEYWDARANRMVGLTGFVEPGGSFPDVAPGAGI